LVVIVVVEVFFGGGMGFLKSLHKVGVLKQQINSIHPIR
jgi:hypothetical protein